MKVLTIGGPLSYAIVVATQCTLFSYSDVDLRTKNFSRELQIMIEPQCWLRLTMPCQPTTGRS